MYEILKLCRELVPHTGIKKTVLKLVQWSCALTMSLPQPHHHRADRCYRDGLERIELSLAYIAAPADRMFIDPSLAHTRRIR